MTITLPAIVGSARDVGLVSRRSVMGRLVAGNYLIDGRAAIECDQGPTLSTQDRAIRNLRF